MSFDSVKLGRNELCPCNSGKKYKKCCLLNPVGGHDEENNSNHVATLVGRQRLLKKLEGQKRIISPPTDSMPKISAAILELAKDLLDFAKDKSQRKSAITAACVAWNMAILDDTDEAAFYQKLNGFFATCVDEEQDQENFTQLILAMVEKKKQFFPDDTRLVVDFEIVDTKTYFSVNVASMLPSPNNENNDRTESFG